MVLASLPSWLVWSAVIVLGLVVGSFLNVVIVRLPIMLSRRWQAEAADTLDQSPPASQTQRFDLATPRSRCAHCDTPIKPWHNLPVVGYLLLGGRCAACGARISVQYPLIEIAAAGLAVIALARFGPAPWAGCVAVVSWLLLAMAAIDWQTQLLPDALTLPLLWLGLLASALGIPGSPAPGAAIIGAASGYAGLWLVFQAFLIATDKAGMGYGDFKLAAALGAWIGWTQLPLAILAASLGGALVGGALMASGRLARGAPMPFGPWLALGGWLAMIAGDTILHAYLTLSGLR
ncbi:A24 family peptidase [Salinisphaera sp. SPP-AMP-43]|uniref:prepilin peptidase n=1 Tax=Salinisphaera sp. SPP-AMP-43 TaxID=3121288 RepID=UPI003C6E74FF